MVDALSDAEMILDELGHQVFHEDGELSIPLSGTSRQVKISAKNDLVFFDCQVAVVRNFQLAILQSGEIYVAMLASNRVIRPVAFSIDPEPAGSDDPLDIPIILTTAVPSSALKIPSRIDRIREIMDAFKKGIERADTILSEYCSRGDA